MTKSSQPEPQPEIPGDPPRPPPVNTVAAAGAEDESERGKPDQKNQPLQEAPFSVATEEEVVCPNCDTAFPITPEVWGAIAECTECSCEFEIRAPQQPTE